MPTRSAQVDAFWQAFRRRTSLDHDHYVVGSFGDSPEMATELADLAVTGIKRGDCQLGTGLRRGSRIDTEARRFRHDVRRRRASTVHLANERGND